MGIDYILSCLLSYSNNAFQTCSSGRDKVLILWDLVKKASVRILPVYECIEGAFIIPNSADLPPVSKVKSKSAIYAASAGEKGKQKIREDYKPFFIMVNLLNNFSPIHLLGVVKIWEMKSGRMLFEQTNSLIPAAKEENGLAVKNLLYNADSNSVGLVSTSHNILMYALDTFECKKQVCNTFL